MNGDAWDVGTSGRQSGSSTGQGQQQVASTRGREPEQRRLGLQADLDCGLPLEGPQEGTRRGGQKIAKAA